MCLSSCCFFFSEMIFSLGSKCQRHAAQSSHPVTFEYLQVLLKSYVSQSLSQWVMPVSCSWLNVASSLQRLLSNTVAREAGRKWSGSQHQATPLLQAFSCDVVIVYKEVHLQTAAKSHTYFKRARPLIPPPPPVLLQLAIDSRA